MRWGKRDPLELSGLQVHVSRNSRKAFENCTAAELRAGARFNRRQGGKLLGRPGTLRAHRAHRNFLLAQFLEDLADQLGPRKRVSDLSRRRLEAAVHTAESLRRID